jgi:hypothetical protein
VRRRTLKGWPSLRDGSSPYSLAGRAPIVRGTGLRDHAAALLDLERAG